MVETRNRTGSTNHGKHYIVALSLCIPLPAVAGGLMLYEVGTPDVGLASAGYSARAQDASTVFTNPAGMTRLPGTQVMLGAQALYGDFKFSHNGGTSAGLGGNDSGNPVGWFPGGGVYATHQVSPDLTIGFAATGNFGLSLKYDHDWVGRYYVREGTLLGMSLLPSAAYRPSDKLSLGASLNATYGILDNRVGINRAGAGPDGELKLEDKVWGFGVTLGILYEMSKATRLGLTYNSEIKLDFEPSAKFSSAGPALEGLLRARGLLDAKVGMEIYVPQGVNVSLFHQANDRWAFLGSAGWQDWSRFGRVNISIDNTTNPQSTTTDFGYKDTWHLGLGAQYRLSAPWLLNFGVAYDSKFQDSSKVGPSIPANDAWRLGLGIQNQVARDFEWGVAAGYVYGGTVDINKQGVSTAVGGRGDLVGSYEPRMLFLTAHANWKF